MSPSRREFIANVGVALAGMMLSRCRPPVVTCYVPAEITVTPTSTTMSPTPTPLAGGGDSPRDRLRACWSAFDHLGEYTRETWEYPGKADELLEQLQGDHRAALDELVAAGEMEAAVANQVQSAYFEASWHIWRLNSAATCYEPVIVAYTPTSADQLVTQAELLAELGASSGIDPATLKHAQAAIERDIAFLALSSQETQALYDELIATAEASGNYGFPSFDELELEVTPEAAEAARFLVELLLGQAL